MTTETAYKYRDAMTGEPLDPDTIFTEDEDGIIVYQGDNRFKFIPKERLESDVTSIEIGYEKPERPGLKMPPDDRDFLLTMPANSNALLGRKYAYLFGIKSIVATKSKTDAVSGFISGKIETGNCSYIELSVDQEDTKALTEYSIIENGAETPILPAEIDGEIEEKLFSGLGLRFTRDENEPYCIYEDGQATSTILSEKDALDYDGHEYTIKYTPTRSAHQYHPDTTEVQVKIVQRCIREAEPGVISSVVILKHGGKQAWNI